MSIVDTPSIMMLVSPPPPMRAGLVPVPVTPGASERQRGEAAVGDRQVLDRFGRDGERPLAALAWISGASALTSTVSVSAADFDRQRRRPRRGRRR